jgi:hypothetical protein
MTQNQQAGKHKPGAPGAFSQWMQRKMTARMNRRIRHGRGKLLSLIAAITAAFGVTTASASASESQSLDCAANYSGSVVSVSCYYNGTLRGRAVFDAGLDPEWLWVIDLAQDGKGVVAYIRTSAGDVLGRVRDASGDGASTNVYIPEGTYYTIRVCLDGAICGERFPGRA